MVGPLMYEPLRTAGEWCPQIVLQIFAVLRGRLAKLSSPSSASLTRLLRALTFVSQLPRRARPPHPTPCRRSRSAHRSCHLALTWRLDDGQGPFTEGRARSARRGAAHSSGTAWCVMKTGDVETCDSLDIWPFGTGPPECASEPCMIARHGSQDGITPLCPATDGAPWPTTHIVLGARCGESRSPVLSPGSKEPRRVTGPAAMGHPPWGSSMGFT